MNFGGHFTRVKSPPKFPPQSLQTENSDTSGNTNACSNCRITHVIREVQI